MTTLTEFLLARIAEDEAVARAVSGGTVEGTTPGPWTSVSSGDEWEPCVDENNGDVEVLVALRPRLPRPPDVMGGMWGQVVALKSGDTFEDLKPVTCLAAHIARHDPARVLAECEAKRAIVEDYGFRESGRQTLSIFGERVFGYLALPHADHPDYRKEWRP